METTSVFFAGLLVGLAFVFTALRITGVSAQRIGWGAGQLLLAVLGCAPVLRWPIAFMQQHHKALAVVGGIAAIVFVPSLTIATLLVAIFFLIKLLGDAVVITSGSATNVGEVVGRVSRSAANAGLISGVLVDHGEAPYLNNPDNSQSYYVELMRGRKAKVVWGVGLADAIGKAGANQGDTISLKHTGRRETMVPVARPEAGTRPVWKRAMRNSWDVVIISSGA